MTENASTTKVFKILNILLACGYRIMYINILGAIIQNDKNVDISKFLLPSKWISKMYNSHTVEYYYVMKMKCYNRIILVNSILCERSHSVIHHILLPLQEVHRHSSAQRQEGSQWVHRAEDSR